MSDEMARDELLALMRAWGWRMESEWPGRYEVWEHLGGWTCIVPSDPEKADYDHLMERAWATLAAAEAPRTLGIVREVARLHQPIPDGMGFIDGTCGTHDEYAAPRPCPTARAVQALTTTEETR